MYIVNILILLALASCGNYSESSGFNEENFSRDLSERVTFDIIKKNILTPHCISCHQQYANYESVASGISSISNAVISNRMPKNAPVLSNGKKSLLEAWIIAGLPREIGQPPSPPVDPKLEATWVSLSTKVFYPKCLACHNPQGQAKFLDLSTRQAFFSQRNRDFGGETLINFEQPEQSYLISVITDPQEPMPPTWSNIELLSEDEINTITEWITQGLP
ncbi:MAG: hypothetical protein CME71_01775 [Halobacteriovorax sp.]|nr:hypothetical protein [Halobacteriovorax sp.]